MRKSSKAILAEAMQLPRASRAAMGEKLLLSTYDAKHVKRLAKKAETEAEKEKGRDLPLQETAKKRQMRAEPLFEEACRLPKELRIELAGLLWDSISDDDYIAAIHPSWKEEIRRRIEAHERGEVEFFDHEEVIDRIRKKLNS
jgi:putative addiction module component (TIGR02574 family)